MTILLGQFHNKFILDNFNTEQRGINSKKHLQNCALVRGVDRVVYNINKKDQIFTKKLRNYIINIIEKKRIVINIIITYKIKNLKTKYTGFCHKGNFHKGISTRKGL